MFLGLLYLPEEYPVVDFADAQRVGQGYWLFCVFYYIRGCCCLLMDSGEESERGGRETTDSVDKSQFCQVVVTG